jgi:hypothetical protein
MLPTPRYLGTRWRSQRGDQLVLWYWSFLTGRRRIAARDCPECADGKVDVGHDSSVAECVELARYLIRKERGPCAADEMAIRFTDEVIVNLPCDKNWSVDACTIRDWVDQTGPVRANWGGDVHELPSGGRPVAQQSVYPGGGDSPAPLFLGAETTGQMDEILAGIGGEAF